MWSVSTRSFTVSDETIREAGRLCRELGTVLHLHVAEDQADVEDARRRGYAGPIERLLALDALVPGSILAHGVHLTRDQVTMAADAGCWFVQNPRSNRGNRVGYPLALSASHACGARDRRVSIGHGGRSAGPHRRGSRNTENAAKRCRAGSTRAGGSLRSCSPGGVARRHAADSLDSVVTWGGRLREVTIGGRTVVRDNALVTADIDRIRREADEAARLLWARMRRGD